MFSHNFSFWKHSLHAPLVYSATSLHSPSIVCAIFTPASPKLIRHCRLVLCWKIKRNWYNEMIVDHLVGKEKLTTAEWWVLLCSPYQSQTGQWGNILDRRLCGLYTSGCSVFLVSNASDVHIRKWMHAEQLCLLLGLGKNMSTVFSIN